MGTLDNRLWWIEHFQSVISEKKAELEKIEKLLQKGSRHPENAELFKQVWEQQKKLCEQEIVDAQTKIASLVQDKRIKPGHFGESGKLSHKEFEESGKVIAKWQKSKGREGLPYKEWKKKCGDRFTKV